jgi:hypothetical protein
MRYNVDQEGGLDEEKLREFCNRLLHVLDQGFLEAVDSDSPALITIEYFGYSEKRVERLRVEMDRQQSENRAGPSSQNNGPHGPSQQSTASSSSQDAASS